MNFVNAILGHARNQPDTVALADGKRTIAYRELGQLVRGMAGHLAALGLRSGERIGVGLRDTTDHVIALLACGLMGAPAAPLDWRAKPAESRRIAQALKLRHVLIEADGHRSDMAVSVVDDDWWRAVSRAVPYDRASDDWNAPFVINATSGTTGLPRFTSLSHLQALMRAIDFRIGPGAGERRSLCAFPLYFAAGRIIVLNDLYRGSSVTLAPALFTAPEFVDLVHARGINIAYVVPSVVRQLFDLATDGERLLPGLDALMTAGTPLTASDKRDAVRRLTPNLFEIFSTAGTGAITIFNPTDVAAHADSVGQVSPLVEAEIVDEHDRPQPPNTIGRLRVRGPKLGVPLPTADGEPGEEFRDGWFYTGDIARLDDRMYLHIRGRTADVILRRGAKIYPAEIEAVLLEHECVAEAAVVGAGAVDGEETVVAFVVARSATDAGRLLAHCRARLTAYKVPQEIRMVASLPRNTAGKINKPELLAALKAPDRP